MLFLDSSIVVALYVPEAKSAKAEELVAAHGPAAICPLAEVEFYSAIARLIRMKAMSHQDGRQVIERFEHHLMEEHYHFHPVSQRVYQVARDWLGQFNTSLRSLDALQLAVAEVHGLMFATADRPLVKAAKRLGVQAVGL